MTAEPLGCGAARLDPDTMGWKQRDWYLPDTAADAFDRNGNAGPTLWVDGRVVGAWAQTRDGEIRTHYFERVAAERRREIDERVAELQGDGRADPVLCTLSRPDQCQAAGLRGCVDRAPAATAADSRQVASLGAPGAAWAAALPGVLADLERRWRLRWASRFQAAVRRTWPRRRCLTRRRP